MHTGTQDVIRILKKIETEHRPSAFACSFGLEDMVLLDLIAKHTPKIEAFTLDTGRLPEETHTLLEEVRDRYTIPVRVYFPDSAQVAVEPIRPGQAPPAAAIQASVAEWEPGRMRITLAGTEAKPTFLLVSENWYPDWHATVDGKATPVRRGDFAFLSVVLPSGAREVRFEFGSADYRRGRIVTCRP